MDYSMRQAFTPTGNWVVPGWSNSDHGAGNAATNTHDFSWIWIVNPGPEPVTAVVEAVDANGQLQHTNTWSIQPRGTLKWGAFSGSDCTIFVRCPRPLAVSGVRVHYSWGTWELQAHPLPAG